MLKYMASHNLPAFVSNKISTKTWHLNNFVKSWEGVAGGNTGSASRDATADPHHRRPNTFLFFWSLRICRLILLLLENSLAIIISQKYIRIWLWRHVSVGSLIHVRLWPLTLARLTSDEQETSTSRTMLSIHLLLQTHKHASIQTQVTAWLLCWDLPRLNRKPELLGGCSPSAS